MIRAHFGIERNPFAQENPTLLPKQEDILETLKVHCNQGGFCLVMGQPGTGKSLVRERLCKMDHHKRLRLVSVQRTMHTYSNTLRILCEAFGIEYSGTHFKCERRLIDEAFALKQNGRSVVTVIDDAHLLDIETLRRLRLLFEDIPHNHNLILFGQPQLLYTLSLKTHEDIKSRITYSVTTVKLGPDDMEQFLLREFDACGLAQSTLSPEALGLLVRSTDGILRKARNLGLACLLEAVRARKRVIDLENVNRVLRQPHWRQDLDMEGVML